MRRLVNASLLKPNIDLESADNEIPLTFSFALQVKITRLRMRAPAKGILPSREGLPQISYLQPLEYLWLKANSWGPWDNSCKAPRLSCSPRPKGLALNFNAKGLVWISSFEFWRTNLSKVGGFLAFIETEHLSRITGFHQHQRPTWTGFWEGIHWVRKAKNCFTLYRLNPT